MRVTGQLLIIASALFCTVRVCSSIAASTPMSFRNSRTHNMNLDSNIRHKRVAGIIRQQGLRHIHQINDNNYWSNKLHEHASPQTEPTRSRTQRQVYQHQRSSPAHHQHDVGSHRRIQREATTGRSPLLKTTAEIVYAKEKTEDSLKKPNEVNHPNPSSISTSQHKIIRSGPTYKLAQEPTPGILNQPSDQSSVYILNGLSKYALLRLVPPTTASQIQVFESQNVADEHRPNTLNGNIPGGGEVSERTGLAIILIEFDVSDGEDVTYETTVETES